MIPLLPLPLVVWLARVTVGLTFLMSSLAKVGDIDSLVIGVLRYDIGPPRMMRRLAPLLPVGELFWQCCYLPVSLFRSPEWWHVS